MGTIDTALFTRMSTFAGLSALIGTRIYPAPAAQDVAGDYVTIQQISGPRQYAMGGATGLVDARFQVDCWSGSSVGVRALAEQVRLALSHYHGTSDSVTVDLVLLENEQKLYDEEAELHRVIHDYVVSYREATS
jgi:hypothetical protein